VNNRIVDVAAGVIQRPDGSFLLAQRPQGKAYEGFWEFPGGKIEAGERPDQALVRELREELGLEVLRCYPWLTRLYHYPHAVVRLHFLRVDRWNGEPRGLEQQALSWQSPGGISQSPLLPANAPILKALTLPSFYAITCAGTLGVPAQVMA
jgi:8-oxo-dGTP diphosphatase